MLAALDRIISGRHLNVAVALVLLGYLGVVVLWLTRSGQDAQWLGNDFLLFWSVSEMIGRGELVAAYDADRLWQVQNSVIPGFTEGIFWVYPPTAALFVSPFASAPYLTAMFVWLALGMAAYAAMIGQVNGDRRASLIALGFPGVLVCLLCGQTGLFVAAVLGLGLIWLEKRPWLAEVMIGLLICKPQFAVLTPFLLLATGAWRSIVSAGATVVTLVGVSVAVFGVEPWQAWRDSLPQVQAAILSQDIPLHRMPSLFVSGVQLGLGRDLSFLLWAAAALPVFVLTVWGWRGPGPHGLKVATAAIAALLCTPYGWTYDMPILAIAMAAIMEHGRREPLPTGAKAVLLLAFFTPSLFTVINGGLQQQVTPLVLLFLWGWTWRLLRQEARRSSPSAGTHPSPAVHLQPAAV